MTTRPWRRLLTVVIVVLVAAAAWSRRAEVVASLRQLSTIGSVAVAALLAVTAMQVVARVACLSLTVPGLSFRRAYVTSESGVAAASSLVGGGAVATGLKFAMLRSWSVAPDTIAVSIVVVATAASAGTWIVAMGVSTVALVIGAGGLLDVAVLAVGVVAMAALAGFWSLVLWHDGTTRRLARVGDGVLGRLQRRWAGCPDVDLAGCLGRGRAVGRELIGGRGGRVVAMTLVAQLLLGGVFVVAVSVVGVPGVGVAEAFGAFALVRVLSALAPMPGGLGVTEVGLVALLTDAGGTESTAIAAVVAFRACTYLLPIVCGGLCVVGWRWTRRSRPQVANAHGDAAAELSTGSVSTAPS